MMRLDLNSNSERSIVVYDGVCPLCNGAVRLLLKIDNKGVLRFASIQSAFAQSVLASVSMSPERQWPQSIVFLADSIWFESDAVIAILKRIGGIWRIAASILTVVPHAVRDTLYRFIARRRYAWFGRYDHCPIPNPQYQSRFLA